MQSDFLVKATLLDPDYFENKGHRELILRIEHRSFSIVGGLRWIPFRGPRVLQWLLTPVYSMSGVLTAKRNLSWVENGMRLQVTPCVPADFFYEFTFANREEAEAARSMIEVIWSKRMPKS